MLRPGYWGLKYELLQPVCSRELEWTEQASWWALYGTCLRPSGGRTLAEPPPLVATWLTLTWDPLLCIMMGSPPSGPGVGSLSVNRWNASSASHSCGPTGVLCPATQDTSSINTSTLQTMKLRFMGWNTWLVSLQTDTSYPIRKQILLKYT